MFELIPSEFEDADGILQICRIYVEVGECLVPLATCLMGPLSLPTVPTTFFFDLRDL